jgi:hypothetical protein
MEDAARGWPKVLAQALWPEALRLLVEDEGGAMEDVLAEDLDPEELLALFRVLLGRAVSRPAPAVEYNRDSRPRLGRS